MHSLVRIVAACFALSGLCAQTAAANTYQTLDDAIDSYRAELSEVCDGVGRFEEQPGFIQRLDLNGDGVEDVILSSEGVICDGAASIYSGASGGSLYQFVLSRSDGAYGIFDGQYQHVEFGDENGKLIFSLWYHGSACGRAGADPCMRKVAFIEAEAFTVAWPYGNDRLGDRQIEADVQEWRKRRAQASSRYSSLATPRAKAGPVARATSVYSDTGGPRCTTLVEDREFGNWTCPGPAGARVELVDTIMRFGVFFGDSDDRQMLEPPYKPAQDGIGQKIEWRLLPDGRPFATIYRAFTVENDISDRVRQVLVVTKLDGGSACHVAYVNAHVSGANETARDIADRLGLDFECGLDRPQLINNPAWF